MKQPLLHDTITHEELRCKKLILVGDNGEESILRVITEPAVCDSLDNHVIKEAVFVGWVERCRRGGRVVRIGLED